MLPSQPLQRCASSAGLDTRQRDVFCTLACADSALSELLWSGLVYVYNTLFLIVALLRGISQLAIGFSLAVVKAVA